MSELAWAAGFFDGEGCVTYVNHNGKQTTRALRINITQIHDEVLKRFQQAVGGLGSILGPYSSKNRKTPLFTFQIAKQAEVKQVFVLLKPYLSSVKRTQFEETIARWDSRDVQFRRV